MTSADPGPAPAKRGAAQPAPAATPVAMALMTLAASALLASAVFLGLRADEAPLSPAAAEEAASERQKRLIRQLDQAKEELGAWQDWYEDLATVDRYPGAGPGILRTANGQKALHDDELTRLHAEPRPEGPPLGPFEVLVDVSRQLRERGIDFVVVPVPPMAAVYPRRALESAPEGGSIPPYLDWRLRAFYLALEREGVEVLDLLPTFLDPPAVPEAQLPVPEGAVGPSSIGLLYRYQDRHWSALGSHVAAGVVASRIERFPWFEELRRREGQAVVHRRWMTATRRGRITNQLVNFGVLPPDAPPEVFLVRRSRIEGEKWSLVDTDSPILLIGDSFGGLEHGFQDALLARLGFRVDAVTVPGGRPSAQLDALALRGNGLSGKRLVIWQFTTAALSKWARWRSREL
ncbi:MAG: hypothetical protein AAF725_14650 [Acidobacteriota bacterium]